MKGARGERNGRAKLSEYQVRRLRGYKAEGWTLSELALRFGISRGAAGDIVSGRRWSHLEAA
jgi:transcriptional regulator with XRE-family HTH domain